jgi:hypothetical protein
VSATISTISSSRQCSRQYIYACELAAAPLFHPIITRRDRHTWDPLAVWRCFAAVCWLLLLVGWWSYRREKRKSLSAAMSAVVSAVESILHRPLYMHNESAGASSIHLSIVYSVYYILYLLFQLVFFYITYRCLKLGPLISSCFICLSHYNTQKIQISRQSLTSQNTYLIYYYLFKTKMFEAFDWDQQKWITENTRNIFVVNGASDTFLMMLVFPCSTYYSPAQHCRENVFYKLERKKSGEQ